MLTWLELWPMLGLPFIAVSGLAALPTVALGWHVLGGAPIRGWLIDHVLMPCLPQAVAAHFAAGYVHAGVLRQWLISALIAINLNALLLPLLFLLGVAMIRSRNWIVNRNLALKREAARR